MIGERVRHARIYYGWSQTQLAEMVGVSQPAISQIESSDTVAESTLATIASVTGFAPWWFNLGPLPDLPEGSLRFRKRAASRKHEDETIRTHVRMAVEIIARLEKDVDVPLVRLDSVSRDAVIDDEGIERLAATTRERIGVGASDPIPNLIRAVERAGVTVIGSAQEIYRHDAASYWPDIPGRPIICFTRGLDGARQRFNIAHELGHLVLHPLRNPEQKAGEKEADLFARALLIPRDAAEETLGPSITPHELLRVKARWGVGTSDLVERAFQLKLIGEDRRTSLHKQISARGWRSNEPVEVQEETPVLVAKMVRLAHGTQPRPQQAARLGIPPLAARDLLAS